LGVDLTKSTWQSTKSEDVVYLVEGMAYEDQYYLFIFGDGKYGMEQSTLYLMSYYDTFQRLENMGEKDNVKGKHIAWDYLSLKKNEMDVRAGS
jgi:hypothetical protein